MLGLRFTIDSHPRWKNGNPPQRTTGAVSNNWSTARKPGEIPLCSGCPGIISDIPVKKTGIVKSKLNQNLLVMSFNSGFSSSSAEAVIGSKAIPQIGQEPGPSRTICGCIGQVYFPFGESADSTFGLM